MPILEYSITGDNSGLVSAVDRSIANIESLTNVINNANISLQFKNGIAALDNLGKKLLVVQGNATLFGDGIANQTQQISAYQTALNSLLANGYDPMDADVQRLKVHIDELNSAIKATPQRATSTRDFSTETVYSPGITTATSEPTVKMAGIQELNQQLQQGIITAEEYAQALAGANSTAQLLGQTTQQASEQIQSADGYIEGLKQQLIELNQLRLTAPAEDLVVLNSEIQQTEIAIQQALNVGKVGFDQFGNSIKGVSVQNLNGQLFALSNNLFGARQISKDLVRTFDAGSISGYARGVGLLAVDFLYYAQNAQFAAGATNVASGAIAAEAGVASTAGISTAALGSAFASLLTPINLIILGVAVAGAAFIAYEHSQKTATQAATAHLKVLQQQKQALSDYISTLNAQQQVEAKSAETIADETAKLNILYEALELQISAGKDYTVQLQQLQDAFPQFFANLDLTTDKTNQLKTAYDNAAQSVRELGLATAASQLAGESSKSQIENQVAANSLLPQLEKERELLATYQKLIGDSAGKTPGGGGIDALAAASQSRINSLLEQINTYNTAVAEAKTKTQQFYDIAAQNTNKADTSKNSGLINGLQQQLKTLQAIEPYLKTQQQVSENISQQKAIQAQLDDLEGKNAVSLLKSKNEELTIQQQIAAVLEKSGADAAKSGLTGYSLQVQEITLKYDAFGTALDKIASKIKYQSELFTASNGKRGISPNQAANDTASLNSARGILTTNEAKQLSDAQISEAQNTADAITKINNDFGVKQEAGYNEELARVKKLYDSIVSANQVKANSLQKAQDLLNSATSEDDKTNFAAQVKDAQDAQSKILAAKADLLPAIQAIDAKYIEQEQQAYDKIIEIANTAFETLDDGEQSRTDKINLEWQKRTISANAYFDKLRDLAKASNLGQSAIDSINSTQAAVNHVLNAADLKAVSEEISKNFAAAMQSAIQGFVSDFYTSITTLGATRQSIDEKYAQQIETEQQNYANGTNNITAAQNTSIIAQINNIKKLELQSTTSFGAIFSGLVSKFNSTFNESILNSFTKQFTENIGKTLLAPSAKQLSISPEEASAQQVASLLKNAGTSLADQIKQAGIDFYNATKGGTLSTGLLSGVSGGSSVTQGLTATGLGSFAPDQDGGISFGSAIDTASNTFQSGSATAAGDIVASGIALQKSTEDGADKISSATAGLAAGASLLGGFISGAASPTSKVGQGAGGLLQGAGEGALIGSAFGPEGTIIGAIGGGLIGLVSGIFSASKAQKELQAQQLQQQQEQVALAKAALAYTSQIIGRDTANGIVTGVSVGAFGQLTATISGKDLQFVLDRNAHGR